eukprot:2684910-Rhodomonas_salina.1
MTTVGAPGNPHRLQVHKAHIWHNSVYGNGQRGDNILKDARRLGNREPKWKLETQFQPPATVTDTTMQMCAGEKAPRLPCNAHPDFCSLAACNLIADKKLNEYIGQIRQIMTNVQSGGQRYIMTLVAQIACILREMEQPTSPFWEHKFNAYALLTFYTSLTMYLWHISDGDLDPGKFLKFHQFCFFELPLHDKRGMRLKDALGLQLDVDVHNSPK